MAVLRAGSARGLSLDNTVRSRQAETVPEKEVLSQFGNEFGKCNSRFLISFGKTFGRHFESFARLRVGSARNLLF